MKTYNFVVHIEQDEESGMYVAYIPALPACHTQAKTLKALNSRLMEAVKLNLRCQLDLEMQIPRAKFILVKNISVTL